MYGKPMTLHDLKPAEIVATLEAEIRRLYEQLKSMDPRNEQRAAWAVERLRQELAEKKRRRKRRKAAIANSAPEGR
jgi:hypothetical protein